MVLCYMAKNITLHCCKAVFASVVPQYFNYSNPFLQVVNGPPDV